MSNPSTHFESTSSLMASQNSAPGPYGGGGYGSLYGTMSHSMSLGHPNSYTVPGPGTPPVLPPLQSNNNNNGGASPYGSHGGHSGFQFSYQSDTGSMTSSPALVTPTGIHALNPMDGQLDPSRRSVDDLDTRKQTQPPHSQQIIDGLQKGQQQLSQYQHHPNSPHHHQSQATHTIHHPQTQSSQQQQLQKQQQQQQQQHVQRPTDSPQTHTAQSLYQPMLSNQNLSQQQQQQQQQQQLHPSQ
ncbi:hypothetical protein BGX20_007514, partial [Mortierella sp. AD010]